jgi:hypothetical protein
MDMINGTQEHTGSNKRKIKHKRNAGAHGLGKGRNRNANATQEHTGSNKCQKTRDAIKCSNTGRDDLETN